MDGSATIEHWSGQRSAYTGQGKDKGTDQGIGQVTHNRSGYTSQRRGQVTQVRAKMRAEDKLEQRSKQS